MLANLLVEPLEGLPAEQEEPSKDQMPALVGRVVHLPQQAVQVALPLEASLVEPEASPAVQVALPLEASLAEPEASLVVQVVLPLEASPVEPEASLVEVLAYQVVLEAYPEVQVAFQEEVLAY